MPETVPDDLVLAVDVGNTRVKFGTLKPTGKRESPLALGECRTSFAVPARKSIDWRAVIRHFEPDAKSISQALVAGVNPPVMDRVLAGWPDGMWPRPRVVERAAELPLVVNLERPDHVGIDRLLTAVAANLLRAEGELAIIISAGTATTVDFVSAEGKFEGGAILPGLELGARALHEHTAFLPLIDVQTMSAQVSALGRNTHDAIRSGLWYGQIGAIRELVARMSESKGPSPLVLVTGGHGLAIAAGLGNRYRFEPDLVLRALALLACSQPV